MEFEGNGKFRKPFCVCANVFANVLPILLRKITLRDDDVWWFRAYRPVGHITPALHYITSRPRYIMQRSGLQDTRDAGLTFSDIVWCFSCSAVLSACRLAFSFCRVMFISRISSSRLGGSSEIRDVHMNIISIGRKTKRETWQLNS